MKEQGLWESLVDARDWYMTEGTRETVLDPSLQGNTVLIVILLWKENDIPDHKLFNYLIFWQAVLVSFCRRKNSLSVDFFQVPLYGCPVCLGIDKTQCKVNTFSKSGDLASTN